MNLKLICFAMLTGAVLLCQPSDESMAQSQTRSNVGSQTKPSAGQSEFQFPARPKYGQNAIVQEATTPTANSTILLNSKNQANGAAAAKPQSPWQITSRIHLEKGTNEGYLVVQMDLAQGYHVYSLDPKSSPSPTRLAVLPSNDLRVTSKFVSDQAPKVIEKDPVFGQRVEKHTGQVQFFAPIQVRAGVDLQKLVQEVQFSGQVCSASACQPIRNHTSKAKFAGYFEIPKTGSNTNQGQKQLK